MLPRWVVKTNVIWWYFSFVLWKACNRSMPPDQTSSLTKLIENDLKTIWKVFETKIIPHNTIVYKKNECFIISLVLFRGRTYPIMHDNECPVQVTCGDQRDYTIKCVKHSWMLASILCLWNFSCPKSSLHFQIYILHSNDSSA